MARVNGIYNLPAGNPVVTGTTIAVSWANSTMPDIGAALTDSWCRDGGTPPYTNMPMAGFKFTGLGPGTLAGDSATFGQLTSAALVAQTGTATTGNDSGAVNALALTLSPALTSYTPGMLFSINRIVATNTGASTIAVNGLTALPISSAFGALQGGELLINADALLRVNAAGTGVELVQTSGNFPVKVGVASGQAINLGQADGRYAALAGLNTQVFSAAAAVTAAEVVNLGQADGRYAPIAYTQFGTVINGNITLTAAQSGTTFEIASGVVTLPAVAAGLRFRFIGTGGGSGVIAAPAGGINYPDGTAVISANTVPITALTTWEIISDGTTWLITNTSGQVITKAATANNQAVTFGQAIPIRTANVTPVLIAGGDAWTVSHSLGYVPFLAAVEYVNLVAEQGFSVGDVQEIIAEWNGTTQGMLGKWKNSTQVGVKCLTGYTPMLKNKSTGADFTPTAANWAYRFVLR